LSGSVPGTESSLELAAPRLELMPFGDLATARRALAERLDADGYAKPRLLFNGRAEIGALGSVPVALAKGCSRLDVVSGAPLRGLRAWLWNADGALVAHADGGGKALLFACSKGESGRLDFEARTRAGPIVVELRKEEEAPELLTRYPLAAGRLLERMSTRGLIKSVDQVGALRAVNLESARLETLDVLIPLGRCIDVTLALGPEATGAEIRIVKRGSATSASELALERGTYATSARACALSEGGTLNARAELRVAAGSTIGLFATRMLSPRE
jgi:hypothetical protein